MAVFYSREWFIIWDTSAWSCWPGYRPNISTTPPSCILSLRLTRFVLYFLSLSWWVTSPRDSQMINDQTSSIDSLNPSGEICSYRLHVSCFNYWRVCLKESGVSLTSKHYTCVCLTRRPPYRQTPVYCRAPEVNLTRRLITSCDESSGLFTYWACQLMLVPLRAFVTDWPTFLHIHSLTCCIFTFMLYPL